MPSITSVQTVRPGKEAELIGLMDDLIADVQSNEKGCMRFDYMRSRSDPTKFLVFEQYVDEEAFETHKKMEYLQAFFPKMLDCLERPPEVEILDDVFPGMKSQQPFFHIGIVVKDLEAAMARYAEVLGVSFIEPATFQVPEIDDPTPHPGQVVAVYSKEGPPYYELIQAAGDGVFSEKYADQILYAGVWEKDIPGRLEKLRAQGVGIDAVLRDSEGVPFVVVSSPEGLGIRIEWVGNGARPAIDDWVRTGHLAAQVAD